MRSRALAALALAVAAFLLTPAPASAGSTRFEIQSSAVQGSTGNGGGISVSGIREMIVFFDCTASSGTGEVLDLYLQSSSDGGTTWFDLSFELATQVDTDGTETASLTNARDFVNMAADEACEDGIAKYVIFGDLVRARWVIGGSSPSYTFSVKAIGKN
jgi:hypothetical protein